MIVLLDTSHDIHGECAAELGCEVGQLLTPLSRFSLQDASKPWAIDNGAYSRFDERAFLSLLDRERSHAKDCLFVALPDVVGSAIRTGECFRRWRSKNWASLEGYKLALVAQDGLEQMEMMPTWEEFQAIFIGGTNEFKLSRAETIIKAAQIMGKWVHVGRVNDPRRFQYFEELGVDSIDGTGISQYSHMRQAIARRHHQTKLELGEPCGI